MALGRLKVSSAPISRMSAVAFRSAGFTNNAVDNSCLPVQMRRWKKWEAETTSLEYQFANGELHFSL
jgi:hypothetical protein